ncbi:MAG TPA: sodium/proton-translocating pyrophosphatase, partial [Chloroflexota bacterium]|nr:sodium/proton-translocating pyrophosphatase [Chloroflexota bacterium]
MKRRVPSTVLALVGFGCLAAMAVQMNPGNGSKDLASKSASTGSGTTETEAFKLWDPLVGTDFAGYEKVLLILNVVVALAGLGYALMLVKQVREAPEGTPRMQEIARAVREGANAYLYRQFRVVGVLIVVITILLYLAAYMTKTVPAIAYGRAAAFLVGSTFSATVGFVGMRLATIGNLRVAAAAQHSFGQA